MAKFLSFQNDSFTSNSILTRQIFLKKKINDYTSSICCINVEYENKHKYKNTTYINVN